MASDSPAERVAFRLKAEAVVREAPDPGAIVEETLAAGALITVHERAGDFLQIITPSDNFGFIAASTPLEPIDELSLRAATASDVSPNEPPGGAYAGGLTTAPAVQPLSPEARARDAAFVPARPLEPAERILVYDRIAANRRSTIMLLALFVLFLAGLAAAIGVLVTYYGGGDPVQDWQAVVVVAGAGAIIGLFAGGIIYFTAPATVLAISGTHQVSKDQEPELYRIVENLSIGSGLPLPKVWVVEDSAPNAFATGRNPGNAHVAATRGLLDKLEKRELEAVIAHEMSHVGNYDTRLMTMVAVAVGMVALVADLMLRFTWYGAGSRESNRDRGGGGLALIILVAAILFIIISPVIAAVIRMALSRQREYLADASGALLCRDPEALADALQTISADPEPLETANKATAHLYICNPLKGHESFLNNLFSTHPPVQDRIRILRAMG